jgi:hypothetical protein
LLLGDGPPVLTGERPDGRGLLGVIRGHHLGEVDAVLRSPSLRDPAHRLKPRRPQRGVSEDVGKRIVERGEVEQRLVDVEGQNRRAGCHGRQP